MNSSDMSVLDVVFSWITDSQHPSPNLFVDFDVADQHRRRCNGNGDSTVATKLVIGASLSTAYCWVVGVCPLRHWDGGFVWLQENDASRLGGSHEDE